MKLQKSFLVVFLALVHAASVCAATAPADQSAVNPSAKTTEWGEPGSDSGSRARPVIGAGGMVVSDDRIASEWGAEILRRGGNAVDAAVATAFMLSVTRPYYASLGGGGFFVYCPAPRKLDGKLQAQKCSTIDYREKAPKAASRDMYVHDGKARTDLSQNGALASGIPGVTAGLLTAQSRWGRRSRAELLREPIHVALEGFRTTGVTESGAIRRWAHLNPEAKRILGCEAKTRELKPCRVGAILRQPDLAKVLQEISGRGINGFYRGWVARKIVDGIREGGGIFTSEDLYDYRAETREPLVGGFEGNEIVTMSPPSSGGGLLLQTLGYVERAKKQGAFAEGFGSVPAIHAMAHSMALAYADRTKFYGDPDQFKVPMEGLLLTGYLDSRWRTFDPARARLPEGPGELPHEGTNTTHFSVIDAQGNAVAITTTINDLYGSGFVPPGTGVFMNNEMDDFSIQPGVPNLFGLVGGEANAIAPGKRPLSSMTPTIVRDSLGNARVVIGGAGGPRIASAVFNVIVNRFLFGMSLPDAVAAPRLHEQWKPAELVIERYGFSPETRTRLSELGYYIEDTVANAKLHALERFPNGRVWGAPDPRGEGVAVGQ